MYLWIVVYRNLCQSFNLLIRGWLQKDGSWPSNWTIAVRLSRRSAELTLTSKPPSHGKYKHSLRSYFFATYTLVNCSSLLCVACISVWCLRLQEELTAQQVCHRCRELASALLTLKHIHTHILTLTAWILSSSLSHTWLCPLSSLWIMYVWCDLCVSPNHRLWPVGSRTSSTTPRRKPNC